MSEHEAQQVLREQLGLDEQGKLALETLIRSLIKENEVAPWKDQFGK